MWSQLKLMVLAKTVLLTQGPIDVGTNWVRLTPPSSLTVVNDGARLEVRMNPSAELPTSIADRVKALNTDYPAGCIMSRMLSDNNLRFTLKNQQAQASASEAYLVLTSSQPIPHSEHFSRLWIRATCPLSHVSVTWRNADK